MLFFLNFNHETPEKLVELCISLWSDLTKTLLEIKNKAELS